MEKIIKLVVATEEDIEAIKDLMVIVEQNERNRWYKDGSKPDIPGVNSVEMQKYHLWDHSYYKILLEGQLAGVILISHPGREHARIDRLYIDPAFQDKGIGSVVISQIEDLHPQVTHWTLDTIQRSPRNHHFYEKMGYKLTGQDEYERYYLKVKDTRSNKSNENDYTFDKDISKHNFRNCNMQHVDIYNVNMQNARFTNMNIGHGVYQNSYLAHSRFTNTNLIGSIFGDSNMNDTVICHVSMAGTHLHDINLGTPEKKPWLIERCEMKGSTIIDSNLQDVSIYNCSLEGMTIDGISVQDLMEVYKKHKM
ncbi:GNAT family N-acetyltransferase [Salipaludibacillus sp. HK11]|uniref:GNAT family N-acetyltransferase n=1 Tax=Salipaludibacillus sp. HK11 TaxID=3394320 RepID=UPI0039FD011D